MTYKKTPLEWYSDQTRIQETLPEKTQRLKQWIEKATGKENPPREAETRWDQKNGNGFNPSELPNVLTEVLLRPNLVSLYIKFFVSCERATSKKGNSVLTLRNSQ